MRAISAVVLVSLCLESAPALAWEQGPAGWFSVTAVLDIVAYSGNQTGVFVEDDTTVVCQSIGGSRGDGGALFVENSDRDHPTNNLLAVAMFARAHNTRVRITLAELNGRCSIREIRTCFDARSCQ